MSEEAGESEINITDSTLINTEVSNSENSGFKPFLEASQMASDRSRFLIYLILVGVITCFGIDRSARGPGWIEKRIQFYVQTTECYKQNWPTKGDCASISLNRHKLAIQLPDKYDPKDPQTDLYDTQIEEAVKSREEALSITLPVLGAKFDINDLGLVSGLAIASLLAMLAASLRREIDNMTGALAKAKTSSDLKLLEMTHVFSSSTHNNSLGNIITVGLAALPVLVQMHITYFDFIKRDRVIPLQGVFGFWLEAGIKLLLVVGIGILSWTGCKYTFTINKMLMKLTTRMMALLAEETQQDREQEAKAKQQSAMKAIRAQKQINLKRARERFVENRFS